MTDAPDPRPRSEAEASEEALRAFVAAWSRGERPDLDRFCAERGGGAALRRRIDEFLFVAAGEEEEADPRARAQEESGLSSGRTLAGFRIVREIGRGGMGIVYEAEEIALRRRVALKVLPRPLTLQPEIVERFRRESATAARIRHRGIVEVHAVGESDGVSYFSMELVDGTSLEALLTRLREDRAEAFEPEGFRRALARSFEGGSVDRGGGAAAARIARGPIETICRIVADVAEALDHAHREGVVHRDVKPPNVLLRRDGSVVLTDFGLAREVGLGSLTQPGMLVGTLPYLSPELAEGRDADTDHRADVYSLGATLYELLTLERPFEGKSVPELLRKIASKSPRDPADLNPRLAPDLVTIVLKAIEKDPARRYATAADFASDLRAFLGYRPIAARRASAAQRILHWMRREPLQLALLVTVVVALGVPTAMWLGGYVLEDGGFVVRARGREDAERIENALEHGFDELGEGSPSEALAAFEEALRIRPGIPEALAGRAMTHLWRGDPETALRELDRVGTALESALPLQRVRRAALELEGRPESAWPNVAEPVEATDLFVAAMLQIRRGEDGDASAFPRAVQLLEKAIRVSPHARAVFHFQLAHAAGHAGDAAAGARVGEALRALWPRSSRAWIWIGYSTPRDDVASRVAAFERSLEIEPSSIRALSNLAQAQLESFDDAAAIATLRRAVALDDGRAVSFLNLGIVLRHAGQPEEALAAFRRARELDPSEPAAQRLIDETLAMNGGSAPR